MTSMAGLLRTVIKNGGMPLGQINERIELMYLNGRISVEERSELIELMHERATPQNETSDWKAMYAALVLRYNDLEARVAKVEKTVGISAEPDNGGNTAAYPKWTPWDGVSSDYQKGAVVEHNNNVWESTYEGQNVWEPGAPGIDERYWKFVEALTVIEQSEN